MGKTKSKVVITTEKEDEIECFAADNDVYMIIKGKESRILKLSETDVRDIIFGLNKAMYDAGMRKPWGDDQPDQSEKSKNRLFETSKHRKTEKN